MFVNYLYIYNRSTNWNDVETCWILAPFPGGFDAFRRKNEKDGEA